MEETKQKENLEEGKKLSYEELEAYANNAFSQAKVLAHENEQLKNHIKVLENQADIYYFNLAMKIVEQRDAFSKNFVSKIVNMLEKHSFPNIDEEENKEVKDECK